MNTGHEWSDGIRRQAEIMRKTLEKGGGLLGAFRWEPGADNIKNLFILYYSNKRELAKTKQDSPANYEWFILLFNLWILEGDYEPTWIFRAIINNSDISGRTGRPNLFQAAEGIDPEAYWRAVKSEWFTNPMKTVKDNKYNSEEALVWGIDRPRFSLHDPAANEAIWQRALTSESPAAVFDLSPETRYAAVAKSKNFYLSYEFHLDSVLISFHALRLEKYAALEEALIRMRHIFLKGEPPSHLMQYPKVRHLLPVYYYLEAMLRARTASGADSRFRFGWEAVYWLLEFQVSVMTTKNKTWGIFPFHDHLIHALCDFDLLGESMPGFLRYFKITGMNSCPTTARKLMAEPTPIVREAELNIPSSSEIKIIHDDVLADLTKKYGF